MSDIFWEVSLKDFEEIWNVNEKKNEFRPFKKNVRALLKLLVTWNHFIAM